MLIDILLEGFGIQDDKFWSGYSQIEHAVSIYALPADTP